MLTKLLPGRPQKQSLSSTPPAAVLAAHADHAAPCAAVLCQLSTPGARLSQGMLTVRLAWLQVLLLDSISTGLDSATTFQIVKALRDFCHLREVCASLHCTVHCT